MPAGGIAATIGAMLKIKRSTGTHRIVPSVPAGQAAVDDLRRRAALGPVGLWPRPGQRRRD
jgi:hypothetical protein